MANIIITTHWSDGDVIPFISMGKHLKNIGHDVTIFTHYCYEERVKSLGINFVPWDNRRTYREFFNAFEKLSNTVAEMDEIQTFRGKYESDDVRIKEYELIKPYCKREDTVIIAKNRSSIAALLIAEKLRIPIIWVYVNPYEYESIENFGNLQGEKLCEEANELRRKIGLKPVQSWFAWQCCPKVKIGLWPKWYKSDMIALADDIKLVGFPLEPLHKSSSKVIPPDLKNILVQEPAPIIISGGSSSKVREEFYKISIKACANLDRKVIVVTRFKELLPDTIPENVYTFDYIPLYESLAYASLIIHHGGIGTVSNAINAGVPQLILADYADRPLNGSIIKKIGLGDSIPPLLCNEENIKASISELLSLDYKDKCDKFATSFKENNTFKNLSKIVECVQGNEEYLINYANIKVCSGEINNNVSSKREKNKNLNSLSKNMRKFLVEKAKKERSL